MKNFLSVKEKMKNLEFRADERRKNFRSEKSADDVKIENQNAEDLIPYVYKQMEAVNEWN